jgi:hypothetical protein
VASHAPVGGITNGGWKIVYNDKPNTQMRIGDHSRKSIDLSFSIGAMLKERRHRDGCESEPGSGTSGTRARNENLTVNGRTWSGDTLHEAITTAKTTTTPIELSVDNGSFTNVYRLNYHDR